MDPLGEFPNHTVIGRERVSDPYAIAAGHLPGITSQYQNVREWVADPTKIDRIAANWAPIANTIVSGSSVVDVGCYGGYFYDYIKPLKTIQYTGVDLYAEAIEEASKLHPGVEFICADAYDLIGSWDYVVASRLLMHVPDPVTLIKHLRTLCRQSLFFILPLCQSTKVEKQTLSTGEEYLFMSMSEKDLKNLGAQIVFKDDQRGGKTIYTTWKMEAYNNA